LSRGAGRVVFVDSGRPALAALRANLAALGLGADVAEVRAADARQALREARRTRRGIRSCAPRTRRTG